MTKEGASGVSGEADAEGWAVSGWSVSGVERWEEAAAEAALEPGEAVGLEVSPNPFRDEAAVTVTLPAAATATVAVYDVLGRRVAVLHEGPLGAGHHKLVLEAGRLPAGSYVIRVTSTPLRDRAAGGAVEARTVTLLR